MMQIDITQRSESFRLGRVACPRLKISVIQTPRGQLPFVLFRVFVDCKLLNSEAGTPLMCGIMQSLKARGILSEFGNQRQIGYRSKLPSIWEGNFLAPSPFGRGLG